ncbi:MAG: hypothetical protein KAT04_15015 [Methylococcales bacterium]|nr:hypothetical protein [Methylococcales bacterium]
MKLKNILIPVTALSLAFSASVFAHDKGERHHQEMENNWEENQHQSENFRGRGRGREHSEEMHRLKRQKHPGKKNKHNKEKYYHDYDRDVYRQQQLHNVKDEGRHQDQKHYDQNPIDTVIDQTADTVKSTVHNVQHRVVDSINDKARELVTVDAPQQQQEPQPENTRWWWPFGDK